MAFTSSWTDPRFPVVREALQGVGGLASQADLGRRWGISRQRVHPADAGGGLPQARCDDRRPGGLDRPGGRCVVLPPRGVAGARGLRRGHRRSPCGTTTTTTGRAPAGGRGGAYISKYGWGLRACPAGPGNGERPSASQASGQLSARPGVERDRASRPASRNGHRAVLVPKHSGGSWRCRPVRGLSLAVRPALRLDQRESGPADALRTWSAALEQTLTARLVVASIGHVRDESRGLGEAEQLSRGWGAVELGAHPRC
jgi:hypothetical protein